MLASFEENYSKLTIQNSPRNHIFVKTFITFSHTHTHTQWFPVSLLVNSLQVSSHLTFIKTDGDR